MNDARNLLCEISCGIGKTTQRHSKELTNTALEEEEDYDDDDDHNNDNDDDHDYDNYNQGSPTDIRTPATMTAPLPSSGGRSGSVLFNSAV